jgi:DNA replication and repair protein RecF
MFLNSLYLKDFRIFNEHVFSFSQNCNIFYGKNGVGKTSILEAIGYLGRGKSFRTNLSKQLIQKGKNSCTLAGDLQKDNSLHRIGIEIQAPGNKRLQLNSQAIKGHASLTLLMPVIWINPLSAHLFLATPAYRRQFINWGVFHFTHEFYDAWKKFNKVLQQRNMALKKQLSEKQISCWNDDLVKSATDIDEMRKKYINALKPFIFTHLDQFMDQPKIELHYGRGWPDDIHLGELLQKTFKSDQKVKYTQFGPHRMDINLLTEREKMAQDFCSQGQHKLLSYVFYLAQGQLFAHKHVYSPIFLIDDLLSELDQDKLSVVAMIFNKLDAQAFISGIAKADFDQFCQVCQSELFHVKHNTYS